MVLMTSCKKDVKFRSRLLANGGVTINVKGWGIVGVCSVIERF